MPLLSTPLSTGPTSVPSWQVSDFFEYVKTHHGAQSAGSVPSLEDELARREADRQRLLAHVSRNVLSSGRQAGRGGG